MPYFQVCDIASGKWNKTSKTCEGSETLFNCDCVVTRKVKLSSLLSNSRNDDLNFIDVLKGYRECLQEGLMTSNKCPSLLS